MNFSVVITASVLLVLAAFGAWIVLLGSYELRSRRRGQSKDREEATSSLGRARALGGAIDGDFTGNRRRADAVARDRVGTDGLGAKASAGVQTRDPGQDAGVESVRLPERRPQLSHAPTPADSLVPSGAPTLDRIAAAAQEVHRSLAETSAEFLLPYRSRTDHEGLLTAVEVPAIPESFLEDSRDPVTPRTLQSRRDLTTEQRVRLAYDIGRLLEGLHDQDIAFGNMQWSNLLVSDGPQPTVLVQGLHYARPMGEDCAVIGAFDPDWRTALDPGEPTFDLDRYQYALLLLRFVSGAGPLTALRERPVGNSSLEAFHYPTGARLLFERAAGPVGSRPTIREWLAVLTEPD